MSARATYSFSGSVISLCTDPGAWADLATLCSPASGLGHVKWAEATGWHGVIDQRVLLLKTPPAPQDIAPHSEDPDGG